MTYDRRNSSQLPNGNNDVNINTELSLPTYDEGPDLAIADLREKNEMLRAQMLQVENNEKCLKNHVLKLTAQVQTLNAGRIQMANRIHQLVGVSNNVLSRFPTDEEFVSRVHRFYGTAALSFVLDSLVQGEHIFELCHVITSTETQSRKLVSGFNHGIRNFAQKFTPGTLCETRKLLENAIQAVRYDRWDSHCSVDAYPDVLWHPRVTKAVVDFILQSINWFGLRQRTNGEASLKPFNWKLVGTIVTYDKREHSVIDETANSGTVHKNTEMPRKIRDSYLAHPQRRLSAFTEKANKHNGLRTPEGGVSEGIHNSDKLPQKHVNINDQKTSMVTIIFPPLHSAATGAVLQKALVMPQA